jgi:hypothetical protein
VGQEVFEAAFVAQAAPSRAPATQVCSSRLEAKQWVEHEAGELGVQVEWVPGAPPK